jgi:hypothetical protein
MTDQPDLTLVVDVTEQIAVSRERLAAAIADHIQGDHHKKPWSPIDCADQVLEDALR